MPMSLPCGMYHLYDRLGVELWPIVYRGWHNGDYLLTDRYWCEGLIFRQGVDTVRVTCYNSRSCPSFSAGGGCR